MNKLLLIAGLALMFLSSGALATQIQGTALQNGLNSLSQGGSFYNVHTSQYSPDEVWEITSSSASATALIFEFTPYAGTNTFGIYDIYNPNTKLQLYNGAATTGAKRILTVNTSLGAGNVKFTSLSLSPFSSTSVNNFTSSLFGYYIDSSASAGGGVFYSQSSLNSNTSGGNGGTTDHMVAFRGNNQLRLDLDGPGSKYSYATFSSGEFILAAEATTFDAPLHVNTNFDYADFVVLVQSVNPVDLPSVPEPTTTILLVLGLLGVLSTRRSRTLRTA